MEANVRRRVVLVVACLVAAGILAGCRAGAVSPDIKTGRADVNAAGDGGSITTSDWTYSAPMAGINWVDRQGSVHDRGRPECLVPGTSTEVRFAAVEVQLGGSTCDPWCGSPASSWSPPPIACIPLPVAQAAKPSLDGPIVGERHQRSRL
jgi:hypothetical protein